MDTPKSYAELQKEKLNRQEADEEIVNELADELSSPSVLSSEIDARNEGQDGDDQL